MSEPTILFVKPKAISAKDKKALRAAGVVVVEVDDPADVKLVKANAEIDSTEMMACAAKAIKTSANAADAFANAICAVLIAKAAPPESEP